MGNSREYESNFNLIALLVLGTATVIIEVLSYIIYNLRIWFIELGIFIIILLSAQFVYKDAKKIDAGDAYPEQRTLRALTWTPTSWGVLVFFLWLFLFPFYLHKREEIYWQNISVGYSTLKTIERDINIQIRKPPPHSAAKKKKYSDNVGICPSCETPYPLRKLERSKYCNRCGELLKKE